MSTKYIFPFKESEQNIFETNRIKWKCRLRQALTYQKSNGHTAGNPS
jgi:hypothetical protein